MPRRTYNTRAGRQRPRYQRTRYTREQVAQVTGHWAKRPSDDYPEMRDR